MEVNKYNFYPKYSLSHGSNTDAAKNNYAKNIRQIDPKLRQDIVTIQGFINPDIKNDKTIKHAILSSVPFIRKYDGVQDAFADHENLKALGKVGLLTATMPEDTRDLKAGIMQLFGAKSPIPNDYQVRFSLIRGSLFEPIIKRMGDIGKKLYSIDQTLLDTDFGLRTMSHLKSKSISNIKTSCIDFMGRKVTAAKIEGSFLARFSGRAMLRVPVLSIYILAALEVPSILKAFASKNTITGNLKNGTKQTAKSGVNIASLTTGGALLGAAMNRFGPLGSLVGLGLGSYFGSKLGKNINEKIDKI